MVPAALVSVLVLTLVLVAAAPAAAQDFDVIRSWFSAPRTATATPPAQMPSDAPREWSGADGASGHPLMQAGAIRAAAANFRQCLEGLWPLAQRRNVPRPLFDQILAGVTPDLRIMDLRIRSPSSPRRCGNISTSGDRHPHRRQRAILAKHRAQFDAMEKAMASTAT
jgi:membrane-bound lytic murein transglycosylase B